MIRMRMINGIPVWCSSLLPVDTVNCVQTLTAGNGTVRVAPNHALTPAAEWTEGWERHGLVVL